MDKYRWDIINAHSRDISLTQQALHSFDDFILRSVPEIVHHNNTIHVTSQLVADGEEHTVVFTNPKYKDPSIVEKNKDVRKLTPHEARIRDLTFSAPMYIDATYTKGSTVQRFNELYIGRMPIMVRSSLGECTDDECEHDPGGYMIINGNEKVVIIQQRIIPNAILCLKHSSGIQSVVHSCSNQWTNSYCALKITGGKLVPPRVEFSGGTSSVPVFVFLRALGWTISEIQERLHLSEEEWDVWYKDSGKIDATLDYVFNCLKNKHTPKRSFLYVVYPHLGRDESQFEHMLAVRKVLAMEQVIHLVRASKGTRPLDTKDQLINKRLDTAGSMMSTLFSSVWSKYMDEITLLMQKCCDKNKTIKIDKLMTTTTITDGLKYALATGNWKTKDGATNRVGVSQSLSRNAFISSTSQLRRVDSNVESEQKMIPPRKLYGDQWGFLCPNETPEGQTTGLVYQMAITAQISTASKNIHLFENITFDDNGETMVYHNGHPCGTISDVEGTLSSIREMRRNRLLAMDLSVTYIHDCIHVWSDAGRLYRPVFVVKNGELSISKNIVDDLKKGRTRFNDLYQLGIVENLDVSETHNALIALSPDDITPKHTHCELHPSMIFGTVVSCSPFASMNPGPRNTYQAAMGKQAMGVYMSSYMKRFDTNGNVLNYTQKPLCVTRSAIPLKNNDMPSGFNAIVACLCDEGYNQEDSTVWNKASIERGMGRSTTYQTVSSSTVARGTGYHKFERPRHATTKNMRDEKTYQRLDDDGLPPPGIQIDKGEAIIGRLTCPKETVAEPGAKRQRATLSRDASAFHNKTSGVVDNTIVFQNDQGGRTAKVRVRVQKIPEIGDKFASRHAQKGTMGMVYNQEDMPFTQDGITPDLIINPHCIPTRMTVGHVAECLASKLGAITGRQIDATPFEHSPVDAFCKEMRAAGWSKYGEEVLYSGRTGKPLKAKVFIGPIFYQKLKHMVSDKLHARPRGRMVGLTRQPNEGRANGGALRWGEMERDVGISYGASAVLNERMHLSSDSYKAPVCQDCGLIGGLTRSGRKYLCSGCNTENIKQATMPYASKLLLQELMSMGIAPKINVEDKKIIV